MGNVSSSPAVLPIIVGDIKALGDVGVTSFDFGLFGADLGATIDNMRRFRDDVIAKVR